MQKLINMNKARALVMDSIQTAFDVVLDIIEEQCVEEPKTAWISVEDKEPKEWEPAAELNAVQHPQHYNHGKYECIDVMVENFGKEAVEHFCLLNAFKYIWRSNYKNGVEDVRKAIWYLDKYLELEGGDNA